MASFGRRPHPFVPFTLLFSKQFSLTFNQDVLLVVLFVCCSHTKCAAHNPYAYNHGHTISIDARACYRIDVCSFIWLDDERVAMRDVDRTHTHTYTSTRCRCIFRLSSFSPFVLKLTDCWKSICRNDRRRERESTKKIAQNSSRMKAPLNEFISLWNYQWFFAPLSRIVYVCIGIHVSPPSHPCLPTGPGPNVSMGECVCVSIGTKKIIQSQNKQTLSILGHSRDTVCDMAWSTKTVTTTKKARNQLYAHTFDRLLAGFTVLLMKPTCMQMCLHLSSRIFPSV